MGNKCVLFHCESCLSKKSEIDDSMMSTAAMTIMHHALPSHENQDMEEEYDKDYDKIDDVLDKVPKAVCSLHSDGTIRIW